MFSSFSGQKISEEENKRRDTGCPSCIQMGSEKEKIAILYSFVLFKNLIVIYNSYIYTIQYCQYGIMQIKYFKCILYNKIVEMYNYVNNHIVLLHA